MKNRSLRELVFSIVSAVIACILVVGSVPSNTAYAQEDDFMLEDITVTAQKREENMQDIGAAVSAISSERLLDRNVTNVQDLQGLVPSLQLGESFGFAQIMIRGIGTDTPFAGGDPSVAMHVDGVVIGQTSAQLGTMFDIERVEVLRGPQGTLYGRNATGGSVNIITIEKIIPISISFHYLSGNTTQEIIR